MNSSVLVGFLKVAMQNGFTDVNDLVKLANLGLAPALMGAVPGALAGGYLAYDRAQHRKQVEPNSINPHSAALAGALLGGGAGGLAGQAAGGIGYERGVGDLAESNTANFNNFLDHYLKQ